MQVACPHCRGAVLDDGTLSGQAVTCPSCGGQFTMPIPQVVTAPQEPAAQAPAEQAPAEQAPAEQAPAAQAPAEQAPAEQSPFPAVGQSGFPTVNTKKRSRYQARSQPAKSPGIAALLSFFWCGLGQLYVGDLVKGLLMVFVLPTGLLIIILIGGETGYYVAYAASIGMWIYGMFDAYTSAERYNRKRR